MNKQRIYQISGIIIILFFISLSCYIQYETKKNIELRPKKNIDSLYNEQPN